MVHENWGWLHVCWEAVTNLMFFEVNDITTWSPKSPIVWSSTHHNKVFPHRERSFGFHLLRGGKNHFSHIIMGKNASKIKSSFIVWRFILFGRDLFLAIIIHVCHDVWWTSWTLPAPSDLVYSRHQDCYILSKGSLYYFRSFSLQLLLGAGGIPT